MTLLKKLPYQEIAYQKKGLSKTSSEILPPIDRESPLHSDITEKIADFDINKEIDQIEVPSYTEIKSGTYKTFPKTFSSDEILSIIGKVEDSKTFNAKQEAKKLLLSPTVLKSVLSCTTFSQLQKEISFLSKEVSERGMRTSFGSVLEKLAVSLAEETFSTKTIDKANRFGLDAIFETESSCYQIEIKTSEKWGNSSSQSGTSTKFQKARLAALNKGYSNDRIHSILLNLSVYEQKPGFYWSDNNYLQINGRYAWEFVTQDPFFVAFLRCNNIYDRHKKKPLNEEQVNLICEEIVKSRFIVELKDDTIRTNLLFDF